AIKYWNATFICYGSSDTNLKTYDIEHLPGQTFFKLDFDAKGDRHWQVDGRSFAALANADHGILVRLRNPHFPTHWLFVCAGLGEWGSSGATRYLFSRWDSLLRQFHDEEFCC